jgi:hypothetical protein
MTIKEDYEKLKGKYNLPNFKEIDNEFEVSTIDREEFLLREIRRKIDEKIELYVKVLERLLQPDPSSLSDMYECKIFEDDEKDELYQLFKKLMFFDRFSIETSIDETDKKTTEFINKFWKEWSSIKEKFSGFIKKTKESWLKETKIMDEERGYLG